MSRDSVDLIRQHLYTLYDEDGSVCTCGDAKGEGPADLVYAQHLVAVLNEGKT